MPAAQFSDVHEIQKELASQNTDVVSKALATLRNQFYLKPGEPSISPSDNRLSLLQKWLEKSPGAQEIFLIWETANASQTSLISLVISVLSSVLNLLSSHYTFHALGFAIIKPLLSTQWSRKLHTYLGGPNNDLIISTLKLFNSMSSFASGRERNRVYECFAWELKALSKLLNMRRRGKAADETDPLAKPDIRTLYIFLLLSFVRPDSVLQVKINFLEQHKMRFLGIFKGLAHDPYPVIRKVLEVCWAGIWSDVKLKRTIKLNLFNEVTIDQIAKLYDRTEFENDDPEQIPADLAHHFLLAICTRPGVGVCFKDRGWYPREAEDELAIEKDEEHQSKPGRLHNRLLANVVKSLKANEDLRQQELVLKILSACPELVAGYWSAAALTLEPRLSSKWIANVSLFGSIISLPIPRSSFTLSDTTSDLHNPAPPPLSTIIENVLPSVNVRNLAKGLAPNAAGLVQHCTAIALVKSLTKFHQVVTCFRDISTRLQENEDEGQWCKRRRELEKEMRRRVPAFEVIMSFAQHRDGIDSTKAALILESANRLLWLYHECLPELVAQTTFDVGRLVISSLQLGAEQDKNAATAATATSKLHRVAQLHVYRLLRSSEQFSWNTKPVQSKNTYMGLLLKAYGHFESSSTRQTLTSLLEHLLANSILFEEDGDEPSLWLASIPMSNRPLRGVESPDGATLMDEMVGVVNFLDDCIQRCLKTTHRYIDEMHSLVKQRLDTLSDAENIQIDLRASRFTTPLLLTLIEQFGIMVSKKLLSPSDVLAIATFLRVLMLKLSSGLQDLVFLQTICQQTETVLVECNLFPQHSNLTSAILREVEKMRICLGLRTYKKDRMDIDSISPEVQGFIDEVENLSVPGTNLHRMAAANELVDWLRLLSQPVSVSEVRRLTTIIMHLYPPALSFLCLSLPPEPDLIWDGMGLPDRIEELRSHLDFDWLFINTDEARLTGDACRSVLVCLIFRGQPTLLRLKRALRLITRSLVKASQAYARGLLLLMSAILERSKAALTVEELSSLKEFVFNRCPPFKAICLCNEIGTSMEVVVNLIVNTLDPANTADKIVVTEITRHWAYILRNSIQGSNDVAGTLIFTWIKYILPDELLQLLDIFESNLPSQTNSQILPLLEGVILALGSIAASLESKLRDRLAQLLRFHTHLPTSKVLQDLIASALDSSSPSCLDKQLGIHDTSFESMLNKAEARWQRRLQPLPPELSLREFLEQEEWSSATIAIISHIIRSQPPSSAVFTSWLRSDHCKRRPFHQLTFVLRSYLNVTEACGREILSEECTAYTQYLPDLLRLLGDARQSTDLRDSAGDCIYLLGSGMASTRAVLMKSLTKRIEKLPISSFSQQLLSLCLRFHVTFPAEVKEVVDLAAQHGLQWVLNGLESQNDVEMAGSMRLLGEIIEGSSGLKAYIVEPFAAAVIQSHMSNYDALRLLAIALRNVQLKPLVVNRYIQIIIQHPQFFRLCAAHTPYRSRKTCVDILFTLFNLHPANTCQVTHVQPLMRIYRGTISLTDRKLLAIFRLFEDQRRTSLSPLFSQWNGTADVISSNSLEAVQSLNPTLAFRTTVKFPDWRTFEQDNELSNILGQEDLVYDPLFLILLFAQMMEEDPPKSTAGWVELFRTNVIAMLIRTLASRDREIRQLALGQIAVLWEKLETVDMQEKPHVVHILSLLKDSIPEPSADDSVIRLPTYITLLLAHSLRGVFYPSLFVYPITARFLLQRPKLDLTDVPLLYNLLYSSSEDWKAERVWMVRYLADGLVSETDWRVFQRRHTWDLLASIFQSTRVDKPLKKAIFEVLANLTCIRQATTSLTLKSGLLSWIEMQLQLFVFEKEDTIAWLKIIENILCIVKPEKVESATFGEWRSIIGRCLALLFRRPDLGTSHYGTLALASRVVLRLCLLSGAPPSNLKTLLDALLGYLKQCETSNRLSLILHSEEPADLLPLPPHRSDRLYEVRESSDALREWGASIELLWRVTMQLEEKVRFWDALTSRLLIWKAIVGTGKSLVADWVSREALGLVASAKVQEE